MNLRRQIGILNFGSCSKKIWFKLDLTIPTYNDPLEGFGKHCGFPAFSPFPTEFSTLS